MNDFIELRRVMMIVLRRWWIMALVAVVAAGIGYAYSRQQTPVYQATTTLLVGQFMQSTTISRTDIQTSAEIAKTYADIVVREPVLSAVTQKLKLNESWKGLKKQVRVTTVEGSQVFEITAEASTPALATDIANSIADQLIAVSPTATGNSGSAKDAFVRGQIDTLLQNINDGQAQSKELDAKIGAAASLTDKAALQSQKATLEEMISGWQKNYVELATMVRQEGASNNYLTVIEKAQATKDPIRPRTTLNTGVSGGIGLILALSILFLIEYFNDTFRSTEELEKAKDLSVLGTVGRINGKSLPQKAVSELKPFSPITESYNMIRSKIQFKLADHPTRSIIITSPSKGEGKSLTAANLGIVMAKAGYRTLIVDADLRHPTLHQFFDVENVVGLANVLGTEGKDVEGCVQRTEIENLSVLTSGISVENPTELLGSERMQEILTCLHKIADVVIIDSPPALHVADASLLSNHADGVVMVVKAGKTRRSDMQQALEHFQNANANLLGCVFNEATASGVPMRLNGHTRKMN